MVHRLGVGLPIVGFMIIAFLLGPMEFYAGDTQRYVEMVAGQTVAAPFSYRVMVPTIVRMMPMPVETGFLITTTIFSALALLVFNKLLLVTGVSASAALLTTAVTAFSYPFAFNLGHWGLVDPAATFFLILALYLMFRRQLFWMTVVIVVGTLAKESILVITPLAAIAITSQDQPRPLSVRLVLAFLSAAIPVGLALLLRTGIPSEPSIYDVNGLDDLQRLFAFIIDYNSGGYGLIPRIVREYLRSYGFFWTFALLGIGFIPERFTKLVCIYLVAVSIGLCLVATDWSRMLSFGFPGIFIPAAFLIERYSLLQRPKLFIGLLILLTAVQCYTAMLSYEYLSRSGQLALIGASGALFLLGSGLAVLLYTGCWSLRPRLHLPNPE